RGSINLDMKLVSACYDAVEVANFAEQFGIEFGRHLLGAGEPVEKRDVGDFQKRLIGIEVFVGKACKMGIGESTQHEVHLADAAPPGSDEITASALVEICAGARCSGHLATFPGDSAHIARQMHDVSLGQAFPPRQAEATLSACDQRSSIPSLPPQPALKASAARRPCFWPMSCPPIFPPVPCVSAILSSPCPIR